MRALAGKIKRTLKSLGHLTPMAAVSALLPIAGSTVLLLVAVPLGTWLRTNWEAGSVLFVVGTLIFCGLALLPTNVIGIVSGWAFSFELGILLLMIGIVGAAFISFLINSRISSGKLQKLTEKHPKADAIHNALLEESFWRTTLIVFLVRMSVIMPFALTNFLMASARVPVRSYLLGTTLGMLPRSSAMVFVGAGLSQLDLENVGDSWPFLWGIAATVVSFIIIGVMSKKALDSVTSRPETSLKRSC